MFQYHFSEELVARLLPYASKVRQARDSQVLCHQQQPLTHLMLVHSGTVSLSYSVGNGRRLLLGLLDCNNTLFGEVEALNRQPCIFDVIASGELNYSLVELDVWEQILAEDARLALHTARSIAAKFQENLRINLDKLLLPLSYNIAKDCILRQQPGGGTLRPYKTVSDEAERFATTERAYRRVVSELVELKLVERSSNGLQPVSTPRLMDFVASFGSNL